RDLRGRFDRWPGAPRCEDARAARRGDTRVVARLATARVLVTEGTRGRLDRRLGAAGDAARWRIDSLLGAGPADPLLRQGRHSLDRRERAEAVDADSR